MQSDIRFAVKQDIPYLCDIWKSCFPDTEEYIRLFYRENFDRIRVPVYTLDGKPVSMIHLMDASFAYGQQYDPVRFIYAVGTLPAARNNGYMRSLIVSAAESAKKDGYGLFLKPSPGMEEYYSALGFAEDSRFRIFTAGSCPDGGGDVSFAPISAEEYNRLRDRAFSDRPYVKWPDAHVRWCVDENAFCKGQTVSLNFDGRTHFLTGAPAKDVLRVTETDLTPEQLRFASSALFGFFGVSRLEAFLPEDALREGSTVVSSFVFNTPRRRTYANLLLF